MTSQVPATRPPLPASAPSPKADPDRAKRTYELDVEYVFHSWLAQEGRNPFVVDGAQGSWVWDGDGTPYLDFSGQLVFTNVGLGHPRVVAAIVEQVARLAVVAPQHANDQRSEAARLIVERAPGDHFRQVFFTNGGADAIENAVRMARLHTGRRKVISRYRSYHGNTTTAINLTGDPRRWPNDYGAEGVVHTFGPFLYRSAFHSSSEQEECDRALEHLEQTIMLEGPSTIAAIVLESVPGTAGIMIPPPGYLRGVRELCDRHGILWIADEVMSGFGRCGRWFAWARAACRAAGTSPIATTWRRASGWHGGPARAGPWCARATVSTTTSPRSRPARACISARRISISNSSFRSIRPRRLRCPIHSRETFRLPYPHPRWRIRGICGRLTPSTGT